MTISGIDTYTPINSQSVANCLSGYAWIGRYITQDDGGAYLTPQEVTYLHNAGLLITSIWTAAYWSESTLPMNSYGGTVEGQQAVAMAQYVGQPTKSVIVLDMEDWDSSNQTDWEDYMVSWASAVNAGGYFPCLYGPEVVFSNVIDATKNHFDGNWLAVGTPVSSIPAGYSVVQGVQNQSLCGITVDYDLMHSADYYGDWTW
ncbi:glycoside hydrolase domain-containing protein [Alicyclobacillus tolerans]|uniref:Rv2525c-like glycoside hydrolase-like domain-containing protein n=1 Tax=Alicyclobacillus tolerans TaxID=90970 RepID=A0ABT9M083_9BACL|nr:glycoside hydrolase domain-containing protein [Alicyclobacillus tengchongensis]MDP9729944.1 hypothetical protein [Alicyclobacillus tengchongensis]